MYKGKKVIVITGGFNEEGKIGKVIDRMPDFVDGVIAVDDGSTDNTAKEAESAGAIVLQNKKNRGAGYVLRKGINYAIENKYDITVIIAGDNQDNPDEIKTLIGPLFDGCDLVQGSRFIKDKKKIPLFRLVTTKMFSNLFSLITGTRITDASNGFRAFKTRVVKNIKLDYAWLNKYELEPYLLIQIIKNKHRIKEVPVSKLYDKEKGYSKMKPFIDWYRICKPLLKEAFAK